MISFRLRLASAFAAAAICAFALWAVVEGRSVAAALFAPGAALLLPLFASRRPPRADEWDALSDNVARFRTAGLICFTIAVVAHTIAVMMSVGAAASDQIAALGVAWWAVGFGLVPFAFYFASRRAMLEDDSFD